MTALSSLAAIFALAFLCESLTEYFFKDLFAAKLDVKYLRYVSALVGVGLCLGYGLDLFHDLLGLSPLFGPLGQVLTGLILGRGANYVHDFYSRFIQRAQR